MTGGRTIEFAKVGWEADAPRSLFFNDIYFSGDGVGEAEHVFLNGNDLASRFALADRFTIGELGFGSGLNFLAAWALWRQVRKPHARLHYLSVEKFPLWADDILRAARAWPMLSGLALALSRAYPPAAPGLHLLRLSDGVSLTLGFGEANALLSTAEARVDAWFLDGFAPAKNPDMWTEAIFRDLARLSAPQATAATFTVAGAVRRGLEAAGFSVEKRPGYGRKREMLTAQIASPTALSRRAPWFAASRGPSLAPGASVAIIGGGVAGASLADAAASAGLDATIIEARELCAGASGNPAGLIMPRLDLGDGPGARFFIAAYLHALRTIARLNAEQSAALFNPCGVFQPSQNDDDAVWSAKILQAGLLPDAFLTARHQGLFFPQAGVIDPVAYCKALARKATIIRARAIEITSGAKGAVVWLSDGQSIEADAVIIANGAGALRFSQSRTLPLSRVAGQIDHFPTAAAPGLAFAFGPYAAPAPGGGVVIGATYERLADEAAPQTSLEATKSNIAAISAGLDDLALTLDAAAARPRASVRCQTPDRLPIAGPAPDFHFYGANYDDLRLGKTRDYPEAAYIAGLYLLTGLGSRGLVTAPLAAEMIVADLTGAPVPVEHDIAQALHPARFFIRELKRAVVRRTK